jgi:hypothetical protein
MFILVLRYRSTGFVAGSARLCQALESLAAKRFLKRETHLANAKTPWLALIGTYSHIRDNRVLTIRSGTVA